MYWIPPPYCWQIQNIPTPRARYPLLQTYKNVYGQDRTAISLYWILERCTTRSDFGAENSDFISKIFRKVNTWGLLRECACFGGPICSRADPHFKAKNTLPKLQKLERTWGNADMQYDPLGTKALCLGSDTNATMARNAWNVKSTWCCAPRPLPTQGHAPPRPQQQQFRSVAGGN
jgi:hypothetical protein